MTVMVWNRIFCPALLMDDACEKSVTQMYMLTRAYTAIRAMKTGKNPTAFLNLSKSAATRKFRNAKTTAHSSLKQKMTKVVS